MTRGEQVERGEMRCRVRGREEKEAGREWMIAGW